MTSLRLLPFALLLAAALPVEGEEAVRPVPAPFRHARPVVPGAAGPNRLAVDVPLLSGSAVRSGDGLLSDLRLTSADGREVPYLLVAPPRREPVWARASFLPIPATKTTSGLEADLGAPRRIDRLRLVGIPAPYLKRLRLEGSGDRVRWTVLAPEGTLFDLPEEGLSRTEVAFPEGEHRWLRLAWNDAKSGRVPLPELVEARLAGPGGPPPALREPIPHETRASEPGRSRLRLRFPAAGLPVAALEIGVRSGNVLREARVLESRLSGGRLVPFELGAATLRRAEREDGAADEMSIRLSPPAEAEAELVVEDGGNPPLPVSSVTALLEDLPWIYFESPDGAPLTARFGAPGLVRPRYDLEAVRAAVTRGDVPTATASWGETTTQGPAPEGPAPAALPAGAALDLSGFRVSRSIPSGPAGLTALRLDAAVLSVSPGLSDLRIADGQGRQVPYLLETLAEPLVVNLAAPRPAEDPRPRSGPEKPGRLSFHRVDLPFAGLPSTRLELRTTARVFSRRVSVLRERLGGRPETAGTFAEVAASAWESADPEREAPALLLDLPRGEGRELYLVIDDGDNAALPLTGAAILLPAHRLRFVRGEGASLTLVQGRSDLPAPRYDLELLAPRLLGAPAAEVDLAPAEGTPPEDEDGGRSRKLFWAVLVGAVVALLVLVGRLLGRGPEPPGAGRAPEEG